MKRTPPWSYSALWYVLPLETLELTIGSKSQIKKPSYFYFCDLAQKPFFNRKSEHKPKNILIHVQSLPSKEKAPCVVANMIVVNINENVHE